MAKEEISKEEISAEASATEAAAGEAQQSGEAVEVKSKPIDVSEPESGKRGLSTLRDFDSEVERVLENFFSRGWLRTPRWEFPRLHGVFGDKAPNVNVIDRDGEVLVEAELPGVTKDDLDVSLNENTVTIKVSTRTEEEQEEGEYHRREISSSFHARTVSLPALVDGDKAKAEFKDGILTLTLPKAEQARQVNIKVD